MTSESLPVSADYRDLRIEFGSIPLWQGIQGTPSVHMVRPFVLSAEGGLPIRQMTDENIISEVVQAYETDEYSFMTAPPGTSAWANALGEQCITAVVDAVGNKRPHSVLEIGAGSLYVASRIMSRFQPMEYVIVDPSVRDSAQNIEVIREYFPHPRLGARRFDLILAFNCLEHVPDPVGFLREIHSRVAPGGRVVLIYPDCEKQLVRGDLNVIVHEHLSYFTDVSSRWILANAGFVVEVLNSQNDTFTAVLTLDSSQNRQAVTPDESALFRASVSAFRCVLSDTVSTIRGHLEAGRLVGFHGATNGLNILFHLSGLGSHPGIRLYDGDVSKVGSFLPTCLAPIMSPTDPGYRENALIIISAMSYFDPISRFAIMEQRVDVSRVLPLIGS